MQPHEQAQFLSAVGEFINEQIKAATQPLLATIAVYEQRLVALEGARMPEVIHGKDGKDAEIPWDMLNEQLQAGMQMLSEQLDKKIAALPVPKDGRDVDPVVVEQMIGSGIESRIEEIRKQVIVVDGKDGKDAVVDYDSLRKDIHDFVLEFFAANPVKDGKDGRDADPAEIMHVVEAKVREYFEANPVQNGKDGTSVTPDEVLPAILLATDATLNKLFNEWPKPKDGKDGEDGKDGLEGKSVGLDDIRPLLADLVARAVDDLPLPVSVVGGLIDRGGNLCLTLSDGSTKTLGIVVGADGAPGLPGKDGRDGLGFKDMSVVWDGERTITFKFALEERVEELSIVLPYMLYRGVWKEGSYAQGDSVSRDGSTWIAMRDTDKQPGTIDSGWVLGVKRGRDGKPGEPGKSIKGDKGDPGKDGRDLTQMGPDGSKWG